MMKQFLRVKQIADQKFQRGEKSCVLGDELNAAEKRVDLIKESCFATGKKLSSCMQRLTPDPSDKRNGKKLPEAALAQCMEEWGLSLGENSVLGMTLVDYAHVQETLANDLLNYRFQIEETVVEPLQNILNGDVEKIIKYRKQLVKLTSEMDAAKARYQGAQRSSQQASGNSIISAAAKAQQLRDETEDIVGKVDQCRDSLTAEMFNLISREPEMSQIYVKLCHLQLDYHRKAFYMLESALPELESQINNCPYQPVFGVSLEEHLKVSRREIATVMETCICWLLESAIEEEGLFRIGGSMIKIKKMKSAFDAGFHHLIEEERDPHNVAGILKLYLRSLPEPLLTYQLYDRWMEAAVEPDHDSRLRSLWNVVNSLPETHLKNLRYLIKFLAKLCQNSDVNKMSVQNVAIVIGPNLIWPQVDECALGMNMTATNLHSSIVDTLITYSEWFFPGECEFYVSTPTSPRHIDGFPPPASLFGSQVSLSTAKLSNGDSAVESMSSSPSNSSPKSPSPRIPIRPRKKAAPKAPEDSSKNPIIRSVSCSGFQATVLARAASAAAQSGRLSNLSVSHEDLLNAAYSNPVYNEMEFGKDNNANSKGSTQPVSMRPKPRPKPPRQIKNDGLPPVAERSRRSYGRPSVPPPERPDSFSKSGSISSEDICEKDKVLDPDDISISFDSSSSDSYNECQMSFMDDSDNEIDDSKNYNGSTELLQNVPEPDTSEYCKRDLEIDGKASPRKHSEIAVDDKNVSSETLQSTHENAAEISISEKPPGTSSNKLSSSLKSGNSETPRVVKSHISWEDHKSVNFEHDKFQVSVVSKESTNEDNFTGGTPAWFDHYGEDKRQTNTVWFRDDCFEEETNLTISNEINSNSSQKLSSIDENSCVDDFRTIIEVGNGDIKDGSSYKSTLTGMAIKLRVNSETQDTRL